MPELILSRLKKIIEEGLLNDLIKAEESMSVFKAIAKNASLINESELYIKSSFAYLQLLSFNDFILSINRLYDRTSERNQTRCIETAIKILKKYNTQFPPIIEKFNTIDNLQYYRIPKYIIDLVDNPDPSLFAYKIAVYFENRLINHRDELINIKRKRDKSLAHNEASTVFSIKLDDAEPCIDFGWEVLVILGWAYFSTVYGTKDNILLKRDARVKGFHINRLIENNLKKNRT